MIQVQDEGCQTKAPKSDFFVTTLGELYRHNKNGNDILPRGTSSIDLSQLADTHGFNWEKVCMFREGHHKSKLALRWFKCMEEEWERRYSEMLTPTEYAFMKKVFAFQDVSNNGRFRIYGQLTKGEECIVLVTEFIALVEDDPFWTAILDIKDKIITPETHHSAHLWIMDEDVNSDHSYKTEGPPDYIKIEGSDVYGPNHGKMERQIELSWRVEGLTVKGVIAMQKQITRATDKFWEKYGVGVI